MNEALFNVVFTASLDPFKGIMASAGEGRPYALIYLHDLLKELGAFPFTEVQRDVLTLSPSQPDWEPPKPHYHAEVVKGRLYIEGELLTPHNPFPSFGASYEMWLSADFALQDLFGVETAFFNIAPAQLVEVRVKGERLSWALERRSLPEHPLLALAHHPFGAVVEKKELFHPAQLVNRAFIPTWAVPEAKLVNTLVKEAFAWGKGLLLNHGQAPSLTVVDGFEEIEGRTLLERALQQDLYLAPSRRGWVVVDEGGLGRLHVEVQEGDVITLLERFGERRDAFLERRQYFVKRKAASKTVYARLSAEEAG